MSKDYPRRGGRAATLTAVDDCDFHQRDFLWVSIEGRGAGRYGEWLGTRYHWGTNTYMKYIYNLIDQSAVAFKD